MPCTSCVDSVISAFARSPASVATRAPSSLSSVPLAEVRCRRRWATTPSLRRPRRSQRLDSRRARRSHRGREERSRNRDGAACIVGSVVADQDGGFSSVFTVPPCHFLHRGCASRSNSRPFEVPRRIDLVRATPECLASVLLWPKSARGRRGIATRGCRSRRNSIGQQSSRRAQPAALAVMELVTRGVAGPHSSSRRRSGRTQ